MSSQQAPPNASRCGPNDGGDVFQVRGRTLLFIVVLLSIIFAVAFLFFYARGVCRLFPPPQSAIFDRQLVVVNLPPPLPRGLDLATGLGSVCANTEAAGRGQQL
ncbi:hypothetical protein CASFOL_012475 [Castilleja foliolosa]|uniref:Uncharacterized protein n=1 Tax=Castilleja foliolosa TaxID=1961234 RepID=A0ABD3DH63_9LAMI